MKQSSYVLCLLLLFRFGEASAQDAPPRLPANAKLPDLLLWLDEHNPSLKAMGYESSAADAAVEAAGHLPDPRVNLGVFATEVETRVGPQRQKLGLSQTLPWRGKLGLEKQIAQRQADASKEDIEVLRFEIYRQFKYLFAEFYYIGKSIEITKEHLILLDSLDSVVDTKYRVGETSYSNLVRIDVEADRFRDRLETLEDLAAPVLASMNALLNRSYNTPLSFPGMLHDTEIDLSAAPEETIFAGLSLTNPQLKSLDHLNAGAQSRLELARLAGKPDFKVGVEYVNTAEAGMPDVMGSGNDPLMLSVGVNIPWNKRKYRAMEQAASQEKMVVETTREARESELVAQLKRAFFRYRDATRKIELYRDSILPKAMESWMVTLKSFESDSSGFLDVIDAEQTLLEFKLSLHQAIAERTRAMADIEMVTGVPLPLPRTHQGH